MWTLMIWTVVAAAGSTSTGVRDYHDWRPLALFSTEKGCKAALQSMNIASRSRCLEDIK